MHGQTYLPGMALRQFVKGYQLWHFDFPDNVKLPFKPYAPRPEQALVFCPRGFELVEHTSNGKILQRPRSYIMGQYTERTNRHIGSSDFITLIINFQPGVLHRVTRIPFNELTNTFVDAGAVLGNEVSLINERLNSTDNYNEMIWIVENYLHALMTKVKRETHPLDTVANLLIEHPENAALAKMAGESYLSQRQFERKFAERIGVTPKLFTRIARTSKAFRIKYHHPEQDWLRIALECGYHDYQHLVRDFKEFAGETPTTYLAKDMQISPERFFGVNDSSL